MGNRRMEWWTWWECKESGWECRKSGWKCSEWGWECGEWGGKAESRRTSWHKVVVTVFSQRCGTVENESCGDVGLRRCDNAAVRHCQGVATTLLQHCHNIKHLVYRPFYYEQFWFLSRHQNVRELQKCLSIEFSLSKARYTLVNSWLCLLQVCNQDKVARLGSKEAARGLGRGKKSLQHNIVDLFPHISTVPDRWKSSR